MRFLRLPTSPFLKSILILTSGSTAAQALSFVSLIILQKWFFGPEDFGVLGLFVSTTTLLTAVSTLKFEYGISIPPDEKKAITLLQLSALSVLLFVFLSVPILFVLRDSILTVTDDQFKLFLIAIPLTVLFAGTYEALTYWNNRSRNFVRLSKSRILQSGSMEGYRILSATLSHSYKGLLIGRTIGHAVSCAYLLQAIIHSHGRRVFRGEASVLRKTLYEFRDFPIFTVPTVFITNFCSLLLIALYFDFYGHSNAGLVSIAIQYIALPFGIISGAFSQVFFQKITTYDTKVALKSLYLRLALRLSGIAALVVAVVYLIPDRLITAVLGNQWAGLAEFMRLAVLWQAVAFVASSLSFIYVRLLKQRIMLLFALLQLAIVYGSLKYSNVYFNDPLASFAFYVTGQVVYYIITVVAAIYFIKTSKLLS